MNCLEYLQVAMVSVKFQAKKRDCDEMFIPFFDDEKSGCDNWESDSGLCITIICRDL